ncbi:PAS domain-containing protein [Tenacibaculum jejuense]|uniref:Putative 22-domain light-and oxygen-sensing histidine kinase n=1 Tax=Tenacibaculum jejuense TaxID=584609 RepID=A0A238UCK8_9FLAO|nr:PAS domain-containing protein [Tenacibaculum jejuense]SNR16943.1 putative 22-domain light-and oxygen-sensing histidine kinase [Tenacibaculum jejuense]
MKNAITEMKSLDILVDSLSTKQYEGIKTSLISNNRTRINMLSFDIHLQNYNFLCEESSLKKDIFSLKHLAKKYTWENNVEHILSKNSFEALILTDINRNILWVNDGFSKMTGYPKNYAIRKTPSFLQGRSTSAEVRERIKQKLQLGNPFKEVIINHKKDKTEYKCEIHIFPLKDNNQVTHFLALEKQIA